MAGQYGVGVSESTGSWANPRSLPLDCYVTHTADSYSHTFYSEVDAVAKH